MKAIHKKRLLNVAKALRESKVPEAFDMRFFTHIHGYERGTPACALGHYASRRDLQRALKINGHGFVMFGGIYAGCFALFAVGHFGITQKEAVLLFSSTGCGGAKTAKAAARYIERFVARKEKEGHDERLHAR